VRFWRHDRDGLSSCRSLTALPCNAASGGPDESAPCSGFVAARGIRRRPGPPRNWRRGFQPEASRMNRIEKLRGTSNSERFAGHRLERSGPALTGEQRIQSENHLEWCLREMDQCLAEMKKLSQRLRHTIISLGALVPFHVPSQRRVLPPIETSFARFHTRAFAPTSSFALCPSWPCVAATSHGSQRHYGVGKKGAHRSRRPGFQWRYTGYTPDTIEPNTRPDKDCARQYPPLGTRVARAPGHSALVL
jgi:hypothetical protein